MVGSHHVQRTWTGEGGGGGKEEKLAGGAATGLLFSLFHRAAPRVVGKGPEFRGSAVAGIYCDHPQGCIYIHKHNGAS